jgi:pimeloyl-ACP methyl ester carboxylesterase
VYRPLKVSRSRFAALRGLTHHIRLWGPEAGEPLILLHGGQDASPTFQFMVDRFERNWRIIAPDWRGHGKSGHALQGYWFPDYIADLDAILEALLPGHAMPLVGHSLGGNIACIYAGLRPERVSRLVSLDGFGLPDRNPSDAPAQLKRWLRSWREPPPAHKSYTGLEAMAARLRQANPRLDEAKSLFLAAELSERREDGSLVWAFDPRHRAPFAILHRKAEWAAYLALVRTQALFVASDRPVPSALGDEPGGLEARAAAIPGAVFERIAGASHNLHHDEPALVAALVERFLTG